MQNPGTEMISLSIYGQLTNSPVVIQNGTLLLAGTVGQSVTMSGGYIDDFPAVPVPNVISGAVKVTGGTATWDSAATTAAAGVTVQNGLFIIGGNLNTPTLTIGTSGSLQLPSFCSINGSLIYTSSNNCTLAGQILDGAAPGPLTMNNRSATLTLTGNAANGNPSTYSGSTTVLAGVLAAGATGALSPNSDVIVSGGTLNVSGYAQSIKSLTLNNSGVLNLGINGNNPALLSIVNPSSTATLAGTINVVATGSQTLGSYALVSGFATATGSFNTGTVPSNYRLGVAGTALDLIHLAGMNVAFDNSSTSGNVHVGSNTIGVNVTNSAPTNSDSASYTVGTSVTSSLNGVSGALAPSGGSAHNTGAYTAVAGPNTVTVTISDAGNNPWTNTSGTTATITQTGYRLAAANAISTPISLGNIHVGGAFGTQAVSISNTATSRRLQRGLDAAFGTRHRLGQRQRRHDQPAGPAGEQQHGA